MISRYGPQGLDNITVYDGIKDYLAIRQKLFTPKAAK